MFRFIQLLIFVLLLLLSPSFALGEESGTGDSPDSGDELNTDNTEEYSEVWAYIYFPNSGLFPLRSLNDSSSQGWQAYMSYGLPLSSYEPITMMTINPTRTNNGVVVLMPVVSCIGDFDGDGDVNAGDITLFALAYAAGDPSADLTGDGEIDIWDQLFFLELASAGCLTW